MISNVRITVRRNGFRINVMRLAVNKEPRLWILFCLNVWLDNWLMSQLFAFSLLLLSLLTRRSVAQLLRFRREAGAQLWTQLPKGHLLGGFCRVLWWHAGAKLDLALKTTGRASKMTHYKCKVTPWWQIKHTFAPAYRQTNKHMSTKETQKNKLVVCCLLQPDVLKG